jgi:phosphohistidine phosphatase
MDLIIWRHAEAQEDSPAGDDLMRALTPRGEKQAARVAAWLDRQLPEGVRILSSPAVRCEQTVLALGRKFKVCPEIAPGASVEAMLKTAGWPDNKHPVLLVGHQPSIGQTLAQLLQVSQDHLSVRKGGVWWLRHRERDGQGQTVLLAVQSAETV